MIFFISGFLLSNTAITFAASEYLRIVNDETPIFADAEMKEFLFYLPYTYYVKLISAENGVALVECSGENLPAVEGYVLYSDLLSDGKTVLAPYVNLKIKTCKSAALYVEPTLKTESRYIFAERELCYYGHVKTESGFAYFVGYGGNVGYVKEDCLYPFTVQNHPNPMSDTESDTANPTTKTTNKGGISLTVRIIIIASLIAAGIIAAFAFRKPRENDASYYDENDFG